MPNSRPRFYDGPLIEGRGTDLQDARRSEARDGSQGELVRNWPATDSATVPQRRSRLPSQGNAGSGSDRISVNQRWVLERHGDMLLSRTELSAWHRPEDTDEVLAHFAIALDKPRPMGSCYRSIIKGLLGIVLLAAAAGAGAYSDVIINRANELFAELVAAPAVVDPKSAMPVAAGPQSTAPVLIVPASAAPGVVVVPAPPAPATVSLQDGIASAVRQMRASLPKKIDALTSMIGVENRGTRIIYENQIAMDSARIDDVRKRGLVQLIVANTCGAPGPRSLLELGGSFRYVYRDMNAKPVITADVTKQDCI